MDKGKRKFSPALAFFIALTLSFTISLLVFYLSYQIACIISPAYFTDEVTGEKHPVMPMGQVFVAGIISVIGGIVLLIVIFRKFRSL